MDSTANSNCLLKQFSIFSKEEKRPTLEAQKSFLGF